MEWWAATHYSPNRLLNIFFLFAAVVAALSLKAFSLASAFFLPFECVHTLGSKSKKMDQRERKSGSQRLTLQQQQSFESATVRDSSLITQTYISRWVNSTLDPHRI